MSSDSGCLGRLGGLILGFLGLLMFIGISDCSSGTQKGMIKHARDWDCPSEYIKYLNKYPRGKYERESLSSIRRLYNDVSIYEFDRVDAWEKNLDQEIYRDTFESYKCHLIDSFYNVALQQNSIYSWETFMKYVPEKYWKDAESNLDKLEYEIWGTESRAWNTATQLNTVSSYSKYLELYPKGRHWKQADKKIIDLSVDCVFSGEHGSLPLMDKTYSNNSSSTKIRVENDTPYTLTLLYSGRDSKRLVLSSHSTGIIKLLNGSYRISATVNASNVRSYAGVENLQGGGYDVSYYISTSYSY